MLNRRDVIYMYDGTFEGLMSAVFDCYYGHDYPYDICAEKNMQTVLFCDYLRSSADPKKADRVINSIFSKISSEAFYYIYCAYLSETDGREMKIFDFLYAGYKFGASITQRMNLDSVWKLVTTAKTVASEAHLYLGFVRFKKLENGVYYSEIEPKGRVLPLLSQHFSKRFASMPFMIHDLNHAECLVYNGASLEIRETDSTPILKYSEDEKLFQDMWREFYKTIEIKERHNEKCRMTLLPKRYWRCMTEFNQ